ncbi:hypothetical protein LX59_01495 [Azomonas agilis]|uniref:Uncharacterized protein n=1 Tax=Azomonas agilis TaxID=116849 RepID=A0A562IZG1_9GAMM|nr:hypothetical protein [Azomonas agilis]TWH75985.1 hypothetical protein LX59_01495 [Azomonas agilis]
MSSARMMRYLKHYGTDLHLWPWPTALWARITLRRSPEAQQLWQRVHQQERLLQQHLCPKRLPETLQQRLRRIPQTYPKTHKNQTLRPIWLPLGMTLACTCTGVAVSAGLWSAPSDLDTTYLANLSWVVLDLILHPEAVL